MSRLDTLEHLCRRNNLEVFKPDAEDRAMWNSDLEKWETPYRAGWYWWACSPGCMPDSSPVGPFPSATRAAEDALNGLEDYE